MSQSPESNESYLLPESVYQRIPYKLHQAGQDIPSPMPADFIYSTDDPYAVALRFPKSSGDAESSEQSSSTDWLVARDLLASGLYTPTGQGDVGVLSDWKEGEDTEPFSLFIYLHSPQGEITLSFPWQEIRHFIDETESLVPSGQEVCNVDEELGWLQLPPNEL